MQNSDEKMKNIDKWLLPICEMIANGYTVCPAQFNKYYGRCDGCELYNICNNTAKLYNYMQNEIERDEENEE